MLITVVQYGEAADQGGGRCGGCESGQSTEGHEEEEQDGEDASEENHLGIYLLENLRSTRDRWPLRGAGRGPRHGQASHGGVDLG